MPSDDIIAPPATDAPRAYAVAWAVIFFALINAAVWAAFGGTRAQPERLPYDPSPEEILEAVSAVRTQNGVTVAHIGGSVTWGVGHAADETISARLQEDLGGEARVFNLGLVGARPLDEFLLAWALKDDADLLLLDENYELGMDVDRERLWREPETYLRHRSLLSAYGEGFFRDVPAAKTCMETWEIALPHGQTAVDRAARGVFGVLPVINHKPAINRSLFGQHPLVIAERFLSKGGAVLRGEQPLSVIFESPEAHIVMQPWSPPLTDEQQALAALYRETSFSKHALRACLTEAFSAYAAEQDLPVLTYLTPLNPGMFPGLHGSEAHAANVRLFDDLSGASRFLNLDDGSLPADAFTDTTHLTASGASMVADMLLEAVRRSLPAR